MARISGGRNKEVEKLSIIAPMEAADVTDLEDPAAAAGGSDAEQLLHLARKHGDRETGQ